MIKPREIDKFKRELGRIDTKTRAARAQRLAFLRKLFAGDYDNQMDIEDWLLYDEIMKAYISGNDVAVILCFAALMERWLGDYAIQNNLIRNTRSGLGNILKVVEPNPGPFKDWLDIIKHVHKVRINFGHFKPATHDYRILQRYGGKYSTFTAMMNEDAEKSLTCLADLVRKFQRSFRWDK